MALTHRPGRIDGKRIVVIDKTVCFKPPVLVVVCRLFQFDACRVADLRQNLCPEVGVVLEKRVQDEHPNRGGFTLFERLDSETIIRCED